METAVQLNTEELELKYTLNVQQNGFKEATPVSWMRAQR